MSGSSFNADRLLELTGSVCNGTASKDDIVELNSMLLADEESCRRYLLYCDMHVALKLEVRADRAAHKACQEIDNELSARVSPESDTCEAGASPNRPITFLGNTLGYFSEGMPLAYLLATVIVGVGLLISSRIYVSGPEQLAHQSASLPSPHSPRSSPFVGRITGMVDCEWEKEGLGVRDGGLEKGSGFRGQGPGKKDPQSLIPNPQSLVSLGDKYALSSGLMEITYDTGAKVILQGPCTYEVESTAGGFLSIGKLTARVEKKGNDEGKVMNDELRTGKNGIPHSAFSIQHLFAVRTPTATVTDLGTEFGVEATREGRTDVQVLQGAVNVQTTGSAKRQQQLTEGNALEIDGNSGELRPIAFNAHSFIRKLPRRMGNIAEDAYVKAVLADDPMGYWPLNEPGGSRKFFDRSGNGLVGYAMNNVQAGQPGPFGEESLAIAVDRTGYIDLGRHDEFAMKNDFTAEAWAWADKPEQSGKIFSAYGGPHEKPWGWGLGIHLIDRNSRDTWDIHNPLGLELAVFQVQDFRFWTDQESGVPQRRWVHVAAVYDRDNQIRLYLNGQCLGTQQAKGPSLQEPVWLSIGHASSHELHNWQGRLAHVAVYPQALSAEQIQAHCHKQK